MPVGPCSCTPDVSLLAAVAAVVPPGRSVCGLGCVPAFAAPCAVSFSAAAVPPLYSWPLPHLTILHPAILDALLVRTQSWQVSAWQTKLLQHIARSAKAQCKEAYKIWLLARTDEFIAQVSEANPAPLRDLAKWLKFSRTRPKIASAPVLDKKGATVKCKKDLVLLWSQQFAEEFSNQVLPLTADRLQLCIADRRQATHAVDSVAGNSYVDQSALPDTVEEWIDCLQSRLPNVRKGKAAGRNGIPNDLYQAAGESGQILLAHLLCRMR